MAEETGRVEKEKAIFACDRRPDDFLNIFFFNQFVASPVAQWIKNLPAVQETTGDSSLIPGLGSSPGGGNDKPLQYSCLENPMDRGAWGATVQRVTTSQTGLSN